MGLSNRWRALITTTMVAIGLAVAWGFLAIWVGTVIGQAWETPQTSEQVGVTDRGEVIIYQVQGRSWNNRTCRTLEGKPLDIKKIRGLSAGYLPLPGDPAGVLEFPKPWMERIAGSSNFAKQPEAWYLVRDAAYEGTAYFEAFDYESGQLLGYFGKGGMRQSVPARDERYVLGRGGMNFRSAGSGYYPLGRFPSQNYGYSSGGMASWNWFLTDGDQVVRVDTQQRTDEVVLNLPGVLAVATATAPYGFVPAEDRFVEELDETDAGELTNDNPNLRPVLATMLAARSGDRVVFWNPSDQSEQLFLLPEKLRGTSTVSAYWLGGKEMLIQTEAGLWEGGTVAVLSWINPQGEIQRSKRLELAGHREPPQRQMAWMASPVIPSPAVAIALTGLTPLFKLQHNQVASYGKGFRSLIAEVWPPLLAVIALGLVGAVVAWRWHVRGCRADAWRWAALVALVGPAGLLAYWLHWANAPKERCASCERRVPRNREACPACEAEWVKPPLVGTEVFA